MKKLFMLCLVVSFLSCKNEISAQWGNGVKGNGHYKTEVRNVDNFTKISSSVSGNVYIKAGNTPEVKIEIDENLQEYIIVETQNGNLKIKQKDKSSFSTNKFNVYITTNQLEMLSLAGSGDVRVQDNFNGTSMEINMAGSGDIYTANLNYGNIEANLAGSGNITLGGGKSDNLKISLAGSGDVDVDELEAKMVNCSIAGSGDIDCYAIESLEASVSGSGDIHYKGTPRVKSRVVGSGDVVAKN